MPAITRAHAPEFTYAPSAPRTNAVASPQSVTRRLLERFALIAFGLYHVPLFINNYPSLGGGTNFQAP